MPLRSALQDVRETTLAAVSGLLGKLGYLASLRKRPGGYQHWGMELMHGHEASQRALKAAHGEIMGKVLREPMPALLEDLHESCQNGGTSSELYVEELRGHFADLLPEEQKGSPAASHLNSVLVALSTLEKNRARATRSTS
jgi:hypothetical protein